MNLRDHLQSALAHTYTLDRELVGGGMARVFLAEDRTLGRPVVIKVLSMEMAAEVSADRFAREVRLAARLQHANIVPLLAAGDADGIPFYTMPYVDGESLRGRVSRGPLPVAETVSILRDVTRALAYAHDQGVVHRDIKPDNVLLAGGAAVVTDFGIGKALAAAKRGEHGAGDVSRHADPTLTMAGVALGTPAYMAPEQAAGDPASDHRADFYALGVMAYELLTGTLPFAARSLHQLMLAKITETPRPIAELRPDAPAPLAALIMRCMEKDPAHRPQTANDVAAALDAVGSGAPAASTSVTMRKRRQPIIISAAALAVIAVVGLVVLRAQRIGPFAAQAIAADGGRNRILVGEFDTGSDSTLSPSITELFRVALAQSRAITVADPSSLGPALQRMQRPAGTRIHGEVARELALREGMPIIVEGRVIAAGERYLVTAKMVSARDGEVVASVDEEAASKDDLIAAVGRLSNAVRRKLGESLSAIRADPPLERATTASLDALRKYTAALTLDRLQQTEAANGLLREAIALDTTFAMAYRKLGNNLYWTRDRADAIGYLRRAYALRDRLTELERNIMLGTYYSKVERDIPRAMGAFEAVLVADPDNIIALDNVAYNLRNNGAAARAESLYVRLVRHSPTAFYVTQLALVRDLLHKAAQADTTYREAIARSKNGEYMAPMWMGTYHFAGQFEYDSAETYIKKGVDWPGIGGANRTVGLHWASSVARVRGRLAEAERLARDAAASERNRGNRGASLAAELDVVRATDWLRGDRGRAIQQVDSVRQLMWKLPVLDRRGNALASAYARLGKPDVARQIVAELGRSGDTTMTVDLTRDSHLAALILSSEGRREDAMAMLRRLNAECQNCHDPELGFLFDAAQQPDSAIAHLERYVETYDTFRLERDTWFLGPTYKRLSELYEAKGQPQKSVGYALKVVELWKNADSELQPIVEQARRRATRLGGERPPSGQP